MRFVIQIFTVEKPGDPQADQPMAGIANQIVPTSTLPVRRSTLPRSVSFSCSLKFE
jgi:hypothetical protein